MSCFSFHFLQEECKPNAQNIAGQTPLHVASETAHPRMIEWLVGYRADPTGADINGVTLLHLILARKNMDDLSQWTPELNHVCELISRVVDIIVCLH